MPYNTRTGYRHGHSAVGLRVAQTEKYKSPQARSAVYVFCKSLPLSVPSPRHSLLLRCNACGSHMVNHGQYLVVHPDTEQPWVLRLHSSCVRCSRGEYLVFLLGERAFAKSPEGFFNILLFRANGIPLEIGRAIIFLFRWRMIVLANHTSPLVDLPTEKKYLHEERALSKAVMIGP